MECTTRSLALKGQDADPTLARTAQVLAMRTVGETEFFGGLKFTLAFADNDLA